MTVEDVFSSISTFVSNRRKTFTYLAGSIGGAYLVGSWGIQKMKLMGDKSRRDRLESDNLSRRFNQNLQDCQFTIQALLPTLSTQILKGMDVEEASASLARLAAKAKEKEREESERLAAEEAASQSQSQAQAHSQGIEASGVLVEREDQEVNGLNGLVEEEKIDLQGVNGFNEVGFNGEGAHLSTTTPAEATPSSPEENGIEESTTLSKSWAQVVKTGNEDGEATSSPPNETSSSTSTSEKEVDSSTPYTVNDHQLSPPPPPPPHLTTTTEESPLSLSSISIGSESVPPPPTGSATVSTGEGESTPEPTRAEIWNEIKILSFTRTITAIYVLSLLSLQTHIQLNLLGRSAYVSSVLSSLPPTNDSSFSLPPDPSEDDERDLERAFGSATYSSGSLNGGFGEGEETKGEERKELERKYLTFSWWLLNEGWVMIGKKVRLAVEEVVGPMPLKSILVYGELSSLFSQIRHKISLNPSGSPYSFSPSLFPSTPSDELLTLSSGGLPESSLFIPPPLRQLLNETKDFLDSKDSKLVFERVLDRLFNQLVGNLEGPFLLGSGGGGGRRGSRFEDVTEAKCKLASLLPTLARQSHFVLNSVPNEFLEAMDEVGELKEFSAIIYSSFDKDNLRGFT